jgi:23S rRNA (pseudouridine1915-N3)-methyltransferase
LRALDASEHVWLLERSGTELSSDELAARLDGLTTDDISALTLVVAGTYGASDGLQRRADFQWSLSRLTFLHEWARALVLEQLYRATKIARNEPYHH